ncbi:hypothetical protein H4582DRAFT_2083989 [Lactarius indigo]|nr:hypothetical protein H4582DRAFT_2083989 [Lactarius indigo]
MTMKLLIVVTPTQFENSATTTKTLQTCRMVVLPIQLSKQSTMERPRSFRTPIVPLPKAPTANVQPRQRRVRRPCQTPVQAPFGLPCNSTTWLNWSGNATPIAVTIAKTPGTPRDFVASPMPCVPSADIAPSHHNTLIMGSIALHFRLQPPTVRLNRDSVNPLAGILIPKPLFQVPAKELDAVSSSAAMPTSKGSKSKKLMIADPNLLTARNLFACDYLKDHSVTKSSFKAVWDSVDSGTRKKYEALSKERKLAACVASAATPSV